MSNADARAYQYRPIYALAYWETIGPFIEAAVADAAAVTGRAPRTLFPATVALVLWGWQTRGTPLERRRIFRRRVVEEFIHRGMGNNLNGSKATHRATLSLMVEALNPADSVREHRPIPRSAPTRPYAPSDIAALHSWAQSQGTPRRQLDAMALLTLGLGAGLATRELLSVRTSDLELRDDHVLIIVWESRPRLVPVLPEWHKPLRRIVNDLNFNDWFFCPGRTKVYPGQVTDFLQRARTTMDVRPSRMRATWLLGHFIAGTPPRELLRISGLKNLAALDQLIAQAAESGTQPTRSTPT
jgi:integrase